MLTLQLSWLLRLLITYTSSLLPALIVSFFGGHTWLICTMCCVASGLPGSLQYTSAPSEAGTGGWRVLRTAETGILLSWECHKNFCFTCFILPVCLVVSCGLVAEWLGCWTSDQQVVGLNPGLSAVECNPGQVVNTRATVTKQYNLVPANGRWCLAAGKVTIGLNFWSRTGHTSQTLVVLHLRARRPRRGRWAPAYTI